MKNNKRSPITDKPLRNPGQSLDEEIQKLINDEGVLYITLSISAIALAGFEWWRWYNNLPYDPITLSILALIVTMYSAFKVFKIIRKLKNLRLGRDGEQAVGQYLELLREKGCRVFHDIVGNNFNLDHVVVSEHGVFVVETKTYSKPQSGEAIIIVDGETLTINGQLLKNNVIIQAKAEANWLREMLKESSGKEVKVKPVIVFPGWYIDNSAANRDLNVWILNPKALPKYIANIPIILSKEDLMLLSYNISRYIRTS